jgi:hypothetical protein
MMIIKICIAHKIIYLYDDKFTMIKINLVPSKDMNGEYLRGIAKRKIRI